MNPLFDWLKDSGTQAMLVLGGTVAAIVAAIGTIYFGRKSLAKEDLTPLEEYMATTSSHLEKVHTSLKRMDDRQKQQDENESLASRPMHLTFRQWGKLVQMRDSQWSCEFQLTALTLCSEGLTY